MDFVGQPIVAPELVRHQHDVAGIEKELTHQTQSMGDGTGYDRQPEILVGKRWVLGEKLLAPELPQAGSTGRWGISHCIGNGNIAQLGNDRGQCHRAICLGRDTDRRVEAMCLLFGFGRLRDDALWEVESSTIGREHRKDFRCSLFELFSQTLGNRIQIRFGNGHVQGTPGGRQRPRNLQPFMQHVHQIGISNGTPERLTFGVASGDLDLDSRNTPIAHPGLRLLDE